jgi:hypothetical protein
MAEELTYEEKAREARLERREWDRIWIEDTTEATEPRVLYIGDSISNGTHLNATKAAERKILFNCYATSKAVDNPYFYPQLKMFIEQCEKRDAIIFNNGLHGWHLSEEEYSRGYLEIIKKLSSDYPSIPIYLALTTAVNAEVGNSERVVPRNEKVLEIARSLGLEVIDLYSVSVENARLHTSDGVHFTAEGYEALAEAVVAFIKERIEKL